MLKRIIMIFIIIQAICAPWTAFANSGPVYMSAAPAYEILALRDCPVIVESETLTLDISRDEMHGWSPPAYVAAAYRMKNPTANDITVQMAFPFIWTPRMILPSHTKITVNGDEIPYSVRVGQNMSGLDFLREPEAFYSAAELQNILASVSGEPYTPQTFDDESEAAVYTVTVGDKYERVNVVASFSIDPAKTRVISNGFNGFSFSDDGKCELSTWIHRADSYRFDDDTSFIVIGEDTISGLEIATYVGGYKEGPAYDTGAALEMTYNTPREYISRRVISRLHYDGFLSGSTPDSQIYAVAAQYLDRTFKAGQPVVTCEDAQSSFVSGDFMSVLIYEVDFPAGEVVNVTVDCIMGGTMDRRNSQSASHTYAYILNPARSYAGFGALDIQIMTPLSAPHIVSSTIALQQSSPGLYTASLDGLPPNDLIFTIYPSPVAKSNQIPLIILSIVGIVIIVAIAKLMMPNPRR